MQFLVFTSYSQTKNDRLISITQMFKFSWYTKLNNSTTSRWNLSAKLFTTENVLHGFLYRRIQLHMTLPKLYAYYIVLKNKGFEKKSIL